MSSKTEIKNVASIFYILAGVLFGAILLAFIFSFLGPDNAGIQLTAGEVVNNTNLALTQAGSTVSAESAFSGATSYTITAIWGVQGGVYNVTIPVANGSISDAGLLQNATVTTVANVSVSYTFSYQGDDYRTSLAIQNNSLAGFESYSGQSTTQYLVLGIIVTLVILIGLFVFFMKTFGSRKSSGGSSSSGSSAGSSRSSDTVFLNSLFTRKGAGRDTSFS